MGAGGGPSHLQAMSVGENSRRIDSAYTGRILMVLISLSLIGMGLLFIWLMARSYLRAAEMRDWPVVECIILESAIEERQHDPYSPKEFNHSIRYGYEWQGESKTGDKISSRGAKWSSKRQPIDVSFQLYPVGSMQKCHVDPENSDMAILKVDSLAPLYSIWFPSLFLVGGAGMLFASFRPQYRSKSSCERVASDPE